MRILKSFNWVNNLWHLAAVSTMIAIWLASALPARAHEVLPAIADMEQVDDSLAFNVRLNVESFIAGIDLTETADTNDAPQAADYDALRALSAEELGARFEAFWPEMADRVTILMDGTAVTPELSGFTIAETGDVETIRETYVSFFAPFPDGTAPETVQVGWAKEFGALVLRQQGVDAPYDGFLEAGALTDPIALAGGNQAGGWETFVNYIPVGFDHIVPKGLDHILFVLGLFFLSTRMRPLLTQVTLFTLAHTITLAAAALGYVTISGAIVEPLIASSIAYVAIENIFMRNLSPWRPVVIFGFGLLHGLGFASVLAEFGLPDGTFVPALIGFNVGVEVGQLAVIAMMFLAVWQAIRIDRGANEANQGMAVYAVLIAATIALLVWSPSGMAEVLENPPYVFLAPMLMIFGLCFGSVVMRDHVDAYRRIVTIPASVFIAVIGIYWVIERVFL
ncbi:HupE/UreJ family protein [Loktanella sp. F6476L]|uniref:HupE/UreJ family protein n=1 Tax=Loktanella sp. F6476L TaxID=2926405 RepID=UPI001FF535EB|nr:HupE/UreJ family protein [Loktanella sp. F6476L]MCK0122620.1 HupE/UreJ family protein [Loktanella sp. F6476L]